MLGSPPGQSKTLVFPGAGISKEEGLRSSVAFYSHLLKGGIGLESSKTLLAPVLLQDPAGQESLGASGNRGPSLCWCWSWANSRPEPPWSKHQAEVSLSLQMQHGAKHSWFHMQGCLSRAGRLGWLQLASAPAGRVALLLLLEECKPPELSLRIGQEKSTNSNRKSKCPLQTCTKYEAIQHKEKNQMLDNEDYIML